MFFVSKICKYIDMAHMMTCGQGNEGGFHLLLFCLNVDIDNVTCVHLKNFKMQAER